MSSLRTEWLHGDPLAAGRALARGLGWTERTARAAAVLSLCRVGREPRGPVDEVLAILASPSRWGEGHRAFDAVRELTLEAERADPYGPDTMSFHVAECAAACAYDATEPADPFDEDRFEWLAANARAFDALGDGPRADAVWSALSGM